MDKIYEAYEESLLSITEAVNNAGAWKILDKMIRAKKLSDSGARYLGLTDSQGGMSFGPQSSAQGSYSGSFGNDFPVIKDYYIKKAYQLSPEGEKKFLSDGNNKIKGLKLKIKQAINKVIKLGGKDTDFDAINKVLEAGYDIERTNKALANDPMRSWKMLDRAFSGKSIDDLMMK